MKRDIAELVEVMIMAHSMLAMIVGISLVPAGAPAWGFWIIASGGISAAAAALRVIRGRPGHGAP